MVKSILSRKKIPREERIKSAISAYKSGASLRSAAKANQIHHSTLRYRLDRNNLVRGKYFSHDQEKKLAKYIQDRQRGDPITHNELINKINEYLKVINFQIY